MNYAKALAKKIGSKVSKVVSDRKQVQKNFNQRKDNSNYYGSYKDFVK